MTCMPSCHTAPSPRLTPVEDEVQASTWHMLCMLPQLRLAEPLCGLLPIYLNQLSSDLQSMYSR